MANFDILNKLYTIPGIVIGLTVHEYCHAFAAYKLGDETAKSDGRLTLNPMKHIDPIGFLFILFAGFGWAKPVSFNDKNLKHPRRDKALIAAAGPFSNLILGFAFLFGLKLLIPILSTKLPDSVFVITASLMLYAGIINLGLFAFNILPLPPLDGSHIFLAGLNLKKATEMKIYRYGMWVFIAIIIAENVLNVDIIPIGKFTDWVFNLIFN